MLNTNKPLVKNCQRLLTQKNELQVSQLASATMDMELANNEVIFKLERFALTTNNITYAAFGDSIGYWQFFPSDKEGWGYMPVWGIATVVSSRHDQLSEGQRFFGYFPMASYLKVQANNVSERGFRDATPYRQSLPSAYNYYTKLDTETSQQQDYHMLLRALFLTSYMLADYLVEEGFFGAQQVVISSASSKTAYGSAFCLAQHKQLKLIGLTSEANLDFVKGLEIYAQVRTYNDLGSLDKNIGTLYIDFSGQEQLRLSIHQHFGSQLKHDCYAGSAANLEFLNSEQQSAANAQFFFAALHIKKRNQELGPAVVSQRLQEMQQCFIDRVSAEDNPWLVLDIQQGLAAAQNIVASLCTNGSDPKKGYIVAMDA